MVWQDEVRHASVSQRRIDSSRASYSDFGVLLSHCNLEPVSIKSQDYGIMSVLPPVRVFKNRNLMRVSMIRLALLFSVSVFTL
jgi:hypothetical protein